MPDMNVQSKGLRLDRSKIQIQVLPFSFSVCKVSDYWNVDLTAKFCFPQRTDEENSLVCLTSQVPLNVTDREDGWRCFRIRGQLEFNMIGIMSDLSGVIAEEGIGLFAISTYNTDYILIKKENFETAVRALENAGYGIYKK